MSDEVLAALFGEVNDVIRKPRPEGVNALKQESVEPQVDPVITTKERGVLKWTTGVKTVIHVSNCILTAMIH